MRTLAFSSVIALCVCSFVSGCQGPIEQTETVKNYYEIDGFYIYPLKQIALGSERDDVSTKLGKPDMVFSDPFREPMRVKLAKLPQFDEQWLFSEGLVFSYVFFRDGIVVAAFIVASDF
jgi:hypothetical protein